MRKGFYLLLSVSVLLLTIPSCQKSGKWTKHTITEEYEYVESEAPVVPVAQEPQEETPSVPKLWKWKAKRMAKAELREQGAIDQPVVVPVKVGYYECNSAEERENLYKLQVNGLLNVIYSEIKNKYERPTYWVDVQLTGKGRSLIVKDDTPVFPEDTINPDYMKALVNPETGLNQYGEFTMDPNVPEDIISLIKGFYTAYIQDNNAAINQYGTPDIQLAEQRIKIAEGLDIKPLSKDPFVREGAPKAETLETLSIFKWNNYVDLYVVRIANAEYCIVVKEDNGQKKIDDIALNSPAKLVVKRTLRCTAADISAKALHKALKEKEAKAQRAKAVAKNNKKAAPAKEENGPEVLEFDEYNPQLAPGIEIAEHAEPTLYQIAKAAEHVEVFNLLAGTYKFKEMGKLKLLKEATAVTKYSTKMTVELVKVSALGRIYFGMLEGTIENYAAVFVYDADEEEWGVSVEGY